MKTKDTDAVSPDDLIAGARVIFSGRKTVSIGIKDGRLVVRAPERMTGAAVHDVLLRNREGIARLYERYLESRTEETAKLTPEELSELKKRAREFLPGRVGRYAGLLGVGFGRIGYKVMRTRWGSCSSKKNLNFNVLIMLAPEYVADSVVAHEVCHLLEMNHSERFYRLLRGVCPRYDEARAWLRKNGRGILERI